MSRWLRAAMAVMLLGPLLAGAACGSSRPAASVTPTITGAVSCPADERQDLTFTGALRGHLECSTQPLTCLKGIGNARQTSGIAVPLNAKVDGQAVQVIIVYWADFGVGTYQAGPPGEGGTSNQGVTLDGIGHWVSKNGTMVTAVDNAASASGTLDVTLVEGTKSFGLSGSWQCPKPPGFCPSPFQHSNPCYGMDARRVPGARPRRQAGG